MSSKLLWTGLTIIVATGWIGIPQSTVVGSVIMIIGCVLYWLDK